MVAHDVLDDARYANMLFEVVSEAEVDKSTGIISDEISAFFIENIVRHHLSLYEEDFEAWRKL